MKNCVPTMGFTFTLLVLSKTDSPAGRGASAAAPSTTFASLSLHPSLPSCHIINSAKSIGVLSVQFVAIWVVLAPLLTSNLATSVLRLWIAQCRSVFPALDDQ